MGFLFAKQAISDATITQNNRKRTLSGGYTAREITVLSLSSSHELLANQTSDLL
jgi:hypothetical protein